MEGLKIGCLLYGRLQFSSCVQKYWGEMSLTRDVFIMRFNMGPTAGCSTLQLTKLCAAISAIPGASGWATGCTLPDVSKLSVQDKDEDLKF